ncbi:4Fe-4S dicluster domain-containing protein [candidate division KSB1 bacterium]|nr:4Fe-4S dicluster domain-containing protein [candidate division KSB1 bacterium]
MGLDRRDFMKSLVCAGASSLFAQNAFSSTAEANNFLDTFGVLVDTTVCIGCRKCEWACKQVNHLPNKSLEAYQDTSVFETHRRPDEATYTVVNKFDVPGEEQRAEYTKVQCMHCNHAACVSACIVGALKKDKQTGAVRYDSWKCIGCRYCMAACPFQIPAYEYHNALTPKIQKCGFCFDRLVTENTVPGCVEICPVEALKFGKRGDLIELAHANIASNPERYIDHVYGEHELGGTSWMYLSSRPMEEMGLLKFGTKPIPSYTEPLQHAIFKKFVPPVSLFAFLGGIMWLFRNSESANENE